MTRPPKGHVCKGTRRWDHTYASGRTVHGYDVDGTCVPTVTEVLNLLNKGGLAWWYGQQTFDFMVDRPDEWSFLPREEARNLAAGAGNRTRDAAADIGTAMHGYAETLARTGTMPDIVPDEAAPFVVSLAKFHDEWKPRTLLTEVMVFQKAGTVGGAYAGTLDHVCDLPGHGRILLDLKTGGDKPGKVYDSHELQLAAYRYAQGYVGTTLHPMPEVDGCAILHVRPDFYELIPMEAGPQHHQAFCYLAYVHNLLQGWKPAVPWSTPSEKFFALAETFGADPFEGLPK